MKNSITNSKNKNLAAFGANRFILIALIAMAFFISTAGKSKAQNVNIPDSNFLAALINLGFDTNNDGQISYSEAAAVTYIDVTGSNISDLTGIEAFINITDLYVGSNNLTSINVSSNTALVNFDCDGNSLTGLNVSSNPALAYLVCYTNQITSLNVSSNPSLGYLDCNSNLIASLNITSNPSLTYLDCSTNSLNSLDVHVNTSLTNLFCFSNEISSLNIMANTALQRFDCSNNLLTSIDVSKNTALVFLFVNNNHITSLDAHLNNNLLIFHCQNNLLTSLNIQNGNNTAISGTSNSFDALNNPSLTCIQVDNVAFSQGTWVDVDPTASFSTNCSPCNISAPVITVVNNCNGTSTLTATGVTGTLAWSNGGSDNPHTVTSAGNYTATQTLNGCTSPVSNSVSATPHTNPACSISGSSSVLGAVANTFTGPANMDSYSWSVNGDGSSISGSSSGSSVSISSSCNSGSYTVNETITKNGCSSNCNMAVSVAASGTITVYSSLYTTGDGNHPSVTKSALLTNLKVFSKHTCGDPDNNQNHYSNIWNGTTGLITNVSISNPVLVTYGGGPAYKYVVTVPIAESYLIIGRSTISSNHCDGGTCTIYTGERVGDHDDGDDLDACSNNEVRFNTVIKDKDGKCKEGVNQVEHGSLLLIISPATLEFTDSTDNLPVVYESVDGNWDVEVQPTPPYGFYASPDGSLSTSVQDSVINGVQFTIIDTGSVWTNTELKHTIQHKGSKRIVFSHPAMVNNRTNKLVGITIQPNPANDNIRILLPNFEGLATVYAYNIFGQKIIEQPISLFDGASASLDISSLPMGVYLISVENSTGRVSTKLIKEN